jgi:hypothetical protein
MESVSLDKLFAQQSLVSERERIIREQMDSILAQLERKRATAQEEVRALLGTTHFVDEMAVLVPQRDLMFTFMVGALRRGWEAFNHADDVVETSPIPSSYEVEYLFLRKDGVPYRIEVMNISGGFSPWHHSLEHICDTSGDPLAMAHASFKVPDETSYGAAVVALRSAGYEPIQHCTSHYGRFSYFAISDRDLSRPTLKPRLNLRDAKDD